MLNKTCWLFAGSLCLTAGLATAADPGAGSQTITPAPASRTTAWTPPPGGPGMNRATFADFDRNGDGRISEQEFDATRSERISQRASEGRPMRGLAGAPSFAEIDRDGDGSIAAPSSQRIGRPGRRGEGRDRAGSDQRHAVSTNSCMIPGVRGLLVCLVASSSLFWAGSSRAGGDGRGGDHDRARQALEAGEVLPLRTILDRVEREYPGQVLEVELERAAVAGVEIRSAQRRFAGQAESGRA